MDAARGARTIDTGSANHAVFHGAPSMMSSRRTTRRLLFLALVLALVSPLADQVGAQSPIVIKFSHVVAPDTPKGQAALRFKELVETRTKGRVRVEVYPNSTLYRDSEELEALQLGAVQMLAPSLAKFGPLGIPEFEVFDLPFLFRDAADVHRAENGELGRRMLAALDARGIAGLAFWDNGFKVMSARTWLRKPSDFAGLKMRIEGSRVLDAQFRALHATPLVMPLSEVLPALRSGLVDGTENTPSNLYTQQLYTAQRHITLSEHGFLGYAVIVNKAFWDELPRDVRETLTEAMRDATGYENAIAQQKNDEALARIRASGVTEVHALSDADRATWRAAFEPAYGEAERMLGHGLVDAVRHSAR
jgi:C4-dicarboxylate-binding protein DctP